MTITFLKKVRPVHLGLLAALCGFIVYSQTIHNGFIQVDDTGFITANMLVKNASLEAVFAAFRMSTMLLYLPVTMASYVLTALLAGIDASAFHFVDLVLHAINIILVMFVIHHITRSKFSAFLCALIFAVHPISSEAVLWASARKDLLSSSFALLSLLFYLEFLSHRWERYKWLSILFYALGLLAKIAIFPLPLLFILLDWMHERNEWKEKIPYALIAVPLMIVGVVVGNQFALALSPLETFLLGAKGTAFLLSQIVWPTQLSIFHLQMEPVTITSPLFAISSLIFVLLVVAVGVLWKWKKRVPALGLAFFLVMLLPTFAAAQKAGMLFFTADKYAYLPLVGLLLAFASGLKLVERRSRSVFAAVSCAVILISGVLAVRTWQSVPTWHDEETLDRSVLEKDPTNPIALTNLGLMIMQKEPQSAIAAFNKAIAAEPHYVIPYFNKAAVLRGLGSAQGEVDAFAAIIPALTERELRGDQSLQRGMKWLFTRLRELNKPTLEEQLEFRLDQLTPDIDYL